MMCLVAYQAKRNKKPVVLLSSTHTNSLVTADECKKPLMILDYNQRKGGVDMFDENLEEFSVAEKQLGGHCFSFTTCLTLQLTIRISC